jgi:hypothetical protein
MRGRGDLLLEASSWRPYGRGFLSGVLQCGYHPLNCWFPRVGTPAPGRSVSQTTRMIFSVSSCTAVEIYSPVRSCSRGDSSASVSKSTNIDNNASASSCATVTTCALVTNHQCFSQHPCNCFDRCFTQQELQSI